MKTTLAVCGAVLATSLTMAAQTPSPQPTQEPKPQPRTQAERPKSGMDKAQTMTITGCLKTWDASMTPGRSGASSGAASATTPSTASPRYVLTDVTHDAMGKAPESATAKQNPYGSTAKADRQSFALEAKDGSVNFAPHLNHKVQLTGSLAAKGDGQPQQASTGTSGSTGTGTIGRSTNAMDLTMPTFSVTALKHVSPSCS